MTSGMAIRTFVGAAFGQIRREPLEQQSISSNENIEMAVGDVTVP